MRPRNRVGGKDDRADAVQPEGDWRIADVERACAEAGVTCMKPSGGSHFKVGNPHGGRRLTIPARRPIKPVYIAMLVRFLDEEGRR